MCLRTIRSGCTVPPSILILLFTIRRPDIMPEVWRSRLALASLWGRSGAGVGAGDAVGAATTSTLTGTIISTATRTLVAATATTSAVGTDHRISRLAAMATGRRLNRFVAVAIAAEIAIDGNTNLNIAAERRIGTGRLRTGLGVQRAVTLFPTGRPMPGNRLAGRAVVWQAIAPEDPEWAVEVGAEVLATRPVAVGRIASEAGISREAVAGTEMPLEEVREDIAERMLAAAATVAPPAWDLEVGAEASVGVAVVAAAVGAG